jgi:hypothetical protein
MSLATARAEHPAFRRGRLALAALVVSGFAGTTITACSDSTTPPLSVVDGGEIDAPAEGAADATGDRADAGDAAPSCNLPGVYGSKACMGCVSAKCCGLVTACESDARCKQLQRCSLDCLPTPDSGGCYRNCLAKTPDAVPLWDPIEKCWYGDAPAGCYDECT